MVLMNRDLPPTPCPSVRNLPCSLHPPQKVETPPPAAIQGPPSMGEPTQLLLPHVPPFPLMGPELQTHVTQMTPG